MSEHALLSPSSSERWLTCPASVRMASKVPPSPASQYAEEGTLAHELAEIEASRHFGHITPRQRTLRFNKWRKRAEEFGLDIDEARRHVSEYVDHLQEHAEQHVRTLVMLEQRLASGIEGVWGTSDAVLVSPDHVTIVDLKYGQGYIVSAVNNPQLTLYALGALDTYGDVLGTTERVTMVVFQPRLNHVSSTTVSAAELREWREWARERAELAMSDDAPFNPSEEACRWCPANGVCRARVEYMTARDFGDPDLLSPAELAEVLEDLPDIRRWTKDVENYALNAVYSEGVDIPGWKVVRSGSRRVIRDMQAAVEAFQQHGFDEEQVTRRAMLPLGELTKLLQNQISGTDEAPPPTLEDVLGEALTQTEGQPSLVPEEDRRPAINPNSEAVKEFRDDVDAL